MIVDLNNGATVAFPPQLVQGLHDASPEQIAEVEALGVGYGLHWETLNLDYTVHGLRTASSAPRSGRRRGRSAAKAAAARANGAKGRRPRKAG